MKTSWFSPLNAPGRAGTLGNRWTNVLVPLDGSELSTWVLGPALPVLARPGVSVSLLRVIPCEPGRSNDLGYQMDSRHGEARDFLASVRSRMGAVAGNVHADLRFGDPATEILREVAEGHHDVVWMSTYGSALLGDVARRVLRSSPAPLLLFRPRWEPDGTLSAPATSSWRQVLVALDGSEASEEILPAAESMARTLEAELLLFRAVPHEDDRRGAEDDLAERAAGLASRGIASSVRVHIGEAAKTIQALTREGGIDAVALTTQVRSAWERAVYGGVTRELLRGADVPVLTRCVLRRRLPLPASAPEHRRVWVA